MRTMITMLPMITTRPHWLAATVSVCAGAAMAQVKIETTDLDEFTSRTVQRLAVLDLRAREKADAGDFAIAQHLLSIASELTPNDADIYRRRIEAAWTAGDAPLVLDLTRRVVELDPRDTVAQLRLISARITSLQTVPERLAAYDAFLGEKGKSLDPSVLSRLALDAALLHRERGDEPAFVEYLKKAMRLDGSNKDAAYLAMTFVADRAEDPLAYFEALTHVLYADPIDPKTHLELRNVLMEHGAYAQALRFHDLLCEIHHKAGNELPEDVRLQSFMLNWLVDGPASVADALTVQVESRRAQIRAAKAEPGRDIGGPTEIRPEDARLDVRFEQVRAITAMVSGNSKLLASSMNDFGLSIQDRLQAVADPVRRPPGMSDVQVADAVVNYVVETTLMRLLTGVAPDADSDRVAQVLAVLDEADPRRSDIEGWRLIHSGDLDAAAARFNRTSGQTLWTLVGLATILERKGDTAGAAREYVRIRPMSSQNILCGYAGWKAAQLGGEPAANRIAEQLTASAKSIPSWIDSMSRTPHLFQSLSADFVSTQASAIDRSEVRVRFKNLSSIPLGMGSGRTINTRLFFGPNLEIGVRSRGDAAVGEVFDADRRLRLMPAEEMVVTLWPDVGLAGYLAEAGSFQTARVRWRVLQGFESRSSGVKEPGPGCLEAHTRTLSREALRASHLSIVELNEHFAGATPNQIPALLASARILFLTDPPIPDAATTTSALVAAVPTWPEPARLLASAMLPPASVAPAIAPLDDTFKSDPSPRVAAITAATRIASKDDPWLASAAAHADPRTAGVAKAHAARLSSQSPTYAAGGPTPKPASTATGNPPTK